MGMGDLGLWKPPKQRGGGNPLEEYVNICKHHEFPPKLLLDCMGPNGSVFDGPKTKIHPSG